MLVGHVWMGGQKNSGGGGGIYHGLCNWNQLKQTTYWILGSFLTQYAQRFQVVLDLDGSGRSFYKDYPHQHKSMKSY